MNTFLWVTSKKLQLLLWAILLIFFSELLQNQEHAYHFPLQISQTKNFKHLSRKSKEIKGIFQNGYFSVITPLSIYKYICARSLFFFLINQRNFSMKLTLSHSTMSFNNRISPHLKYPRFLCNASILSFSTFWLLQLPVATQTMKWDYIILA